MVFIKGYRVSAEDGSILVSTLGKYSVQTWYFDQRGKLHGYDLTNHPGEWDPMQFPRPGIIPTPPDDVLNALKIFREQYLDMNKESA